MKQKKHIDRLFQEGLKDFEATPSNAVWKNIEAKLNNKKEKKRIIPIWWRMGGAAAILLISLFVGINYFKSPEAIQVVDTEQNTPNPYLEQDNSTITRGHKTQIKQAQDTTPNNGFMLNKENTAITNNKPKNTDNKQQSTNNTQNNISTQHKTTTIAQSKTDKNKQQKQIKQSEANNSNNKQTNFAQNKSDKSTIYTKENPEKEDLKTNSQQLATNNKKESPSIEQAIAENTETTKTQNPKAMRWRIAPNIAPVYFNSLGNGSSIDAQFNNNSKTGEITMSYGINASYAVNKKIRIRTGINKVNLGYNTNDVIVFESTSAKVSTLKNINTSTGENPKDVSAISSENLSTTNKGPKSFLNTSINQSFGFIEIPLELEYALLDKKLGINIIGGFSSFFLNDNQVYSKFDGGNKSLIGEANNINDISYSANLGLGLNYKITKKVNFNLEPMFKYQINTFDNTSGDFEPYFIGVYTGVAIKF